MTRWYEFEEEVQGIGRAGDRFTRRLRVARLEPTVGYVPAAARQLGMVTADASFDLRGNASNSGKCGLPPPSLCPLCLCGELFF